MWHMKFISSNKNEAHTAVTERCAAPATVPQKVADMVHTAIDLCADPGDGQGVLVECFGNCPDYTRPVELTMSLCVTPAAMPVIDAG